MILALHGFLGTQSDWSIWERSDVIAVDLYSYSHLPLVDAAKQLVEDFPSYQVLVGYSMGGRLAMHMNALRQSESLVLVSAHPGLSSESNRLQRLENDKKWATKFKTLDWTKLIAEWNQQSVFANQRNDYQEENYSRSHLANCLDNWSVSRQADFSEALCSRKKPTLLISGERDEKYANIYSRLSSKSIDINHQNMSNCGHRVIFEQPELFVQEVEKWLRCL